MLPALNGYGLLPEGDHVADMAAIRTCFGATPHRLALLDTLEAFLPPLLAQYGFNGDIFLDGGFITAKPYPMDIDIVLEASGEPNSVFHPLARRVIADHLHWHETLRMDVHLRHPAIIKHKDILALFRRVRDQYAAAYNVPPTVRKGLVRWTP